jgi:hypothetical protein
MLKMVFKSFCINMVKIINGFFLPTLKNDLSYHSGWRKQSGDIPEDPGKTTGLQA